MNKQQKTKTCFIITRYFIKSINMIRCIVRNERGVNYQVTVYENGHTHCTCTAGIYNQRCYHVKYVLSKEEGRRNPQMVRAEAARMVCEALGMVTALEYKEDLYRTAEALKMYAHINATPPTDIINKVPCGLKDTSAKGTLSSNLGFALLKR